MARVEDPQRFTLPVEPLVRSLVEQSAPGFDTSPGSAFYDLAIAPSSLISQHFGDYVRVLHRNGSLGQWATMLPEELERLASNYGVSRSVGSRSSGVQRVTFPATDTVTVSTAARFTGLAGAQYRPVKTVVYPSSQLVANQLVSSGEHYIDVPVESVDVGAETGALAGAVTQVSGIAGALRTFNPEDYTSGHASEGNSELYQRVLSSIANRDLVKAVGIEAALVTRFPSVRGVRVVGYGDPLMIRDVIGIQLQDYPLITRSFAQRVNLPLDGDGQVVWTDASGAAITGPLGGLQGAFYDLVGVDLSAAPLSRNTSTGVVLESVSVAPGDTVEFLDDLDPDKGSYRVVAVGRVPVVAGGPDTLVVRVDRPFSDVATVPDVSSRPYSIRGRYTSSQFHVGGRVDVYVTTSAETSSSVVISGLPELQPGGDAGEIPMVAQNDMFTGAGFNSDVLTIESVEVLDQGTDLAVATLLAGTDYMYVSQEQRAQYTEAASDVIVLRGTQLDQLTGLQVPKFVGKRLRVRYSHNPELQSIRDYLVANQDLTKDLVARTPGVLLVDLEVQYTGGPSLTDAEIMLRAFLNSRALGSTLTAQEVIQLLTSLGATDVVSPVLLRSRSQADNGTFTYVNSEDRLEAAANQVFRLSSAVLQRN